MKITKQGQELIITNGEDTIYYFIKYNENSKIIKRSHGVVLGNSFRYDGLFVKKYGRGKMKNEAKVYEIIENAENLLRDNGYSFMQFV